MELLLYLELFGVTPIYGVTPIFGVIWSSNLLGYEFFLDKFD
jgi:hypothetical protein